MSNPNQNSHLGTAPMGKLMLKMAVPAVVAQVVNLLYNIVDRIYIGQGVGAMALTGVGLCMPLMMFMNAFAMLAGAGGAPRAAIAMGRGERCGRLLPGYEADLAMLDFTAPHLNPCHNVISHVVYAAHGSDVELTMVRGRTVYENRRFPGIDMAEEIRRVNELVAKYLA